MRLALVGLLACGSTPDLDEASFGTQRAALEYPTLGEWHELYIEAREEMRDIGSTGEWNVLTTQITGIVQVVKNGETPELLFQPCQVILPEVAGITPTLPDSTVQAAAPVLVKGRWSQVDGKFHLDTPDWSAMIFGADLAAPLTDALPTDKNDARVVDLDDDGKPGVTMRASIGRLYMVMRGQMRLNGVLDETTGALTGTAEYTRDFHIFGDNVFGIAKNQVDKTYANSETRPAPTTGTLTPKSGDSPHFCVP